MTKINFVTSFNEEIYKVAGHHLINSIDNNWEPSLKLKCYYHKLDPKNYSFKSDISLEPLDSIEEYTEFLKVNKEHDGTEFGKIPYNWRLDALRWSHKVFALTEYAFELSEKDAQAGWLIWIDADSVSSKRLVPDDILGMLPEACDIAFAGARDIDGGRYVDCSFMAFNLNKRPALDLLGDLRGAYISGELLQYREWNDAFITERLLNIYKAHGMKIQPVPQIKEYITHFEGIHNVNNIPVRDAQGNRLVSLSEEQTSQDITPSRHKHLADIIRQHKPKSIVETGTWNGGRAIEMSLAAFENQDEIHYKGFDLFEDGTMETDAEEFNVKAHNTKAAVVKRLNQFKEKMKEKNKIFNFEIVKGNSRTTLKEHKNVNADFALIGGGNSIKTTESDYQNLKHIPVVMVDNFFREDDDKNIPDKKYHGTNTLTDRLKGHKTIRRWIIPSQDRVRGGGHTHMALILHDKSLPDIPKSLLSVPIVVNPRDCVPKDFIRDNIRNNLKLIKTWLGKFPLHKGNVILVSGGPYLNIEELKTHIRNNPTSKIVCVKHSYPTLINNGIIPWACIVLDPRPITGTSTHGVVRK